MPKNAYKTNPLTAEYEEKAKNLLKGELKRRGVTYAGLVEKLGALGVQETERNLANKISRGRIYGGVSHPMLRSYRLSAIAIGLALAGGANAKPVAAAQHSGDNSAERQPQIAQPAPPQIPPLLQSDVGRIAKALETANTRDSAPGKQKDTKDNLQAQRDMADAAQKAVIVAKIEAAITFIGVILVGFTLYYTKQAADAARDAVTEAKAATKVANKTLAQSEDQTKRELRAYLSIEPAGINQLFNADAEAIGHVVIRNVGKLPARNVFVRVDMSLGMTRDFIPGMIPDERDIERTIQPGSHMRQGSRHKFGIADIRNSKTVSYVWGVAWYEDGYGTRRYTRFCHRYPGAKSLATGRRVVRCSTYRTASRHNH